MVQILARRSINWYL